MTQYGPRYTKQQQLRVISHLITSPIVSSRRVGYNRVYFITEDGSEHFIFHTTIVASINPGKTVLTLDDGGWKTQSTKSAQQDAICVFKIDASQVSIVNRSS